MSAWQPQRRLPPSAMFELYGVAERSVRFIAAQ